MSRREVIVDGEKMWFCGLTGVVKGEKKWSETRVSGGGGGGHVMNGSGFNTSVSVSSTVALRHEFWVVSPNGQECCITSSDNGLVVREGQWVTVLWGGSVKQNSGAYLMFRNHNVDPPVNRNLITDCKDMLERTGLNQPVQRAWLICAASLLLAFCSLAFSISNGLPLSLIGFFIWVVLLAARGRLRLTKWKKVMSAAAEAMELEIKEARGQGKFQPAMRQRLAR